MGEVLPPDIDEGSADEVDGETVLVMAKVMIRMVGMGWARSADLGRYF